MFANLGTAAGEWQALVSSIESLQRHVGDF
jgi:hypothetical protein